MPDTINDLDFINSLYYSVNLVLCLLTFALNGLVLYIILLKFKARSSELKLILLLCSYEIILGIEQLVLSVLKLTYGYHFYDPGSITCLVFGFLRTLIVRIEIILVSVIALWRYLLVIHNIERKFKFYLFLTIILSIPVTTLFLYGLIIQDQNPSVAYLNCFPLTSPSLITTIFNISLTLSLVIPCWLTTYFYFAIGWKANKKLNEMQKSAIVDNDLELVKTIKNEKLKLILQLTMMFIIYNINFMPSYVTHILKLAINFKRTPFLELVVILGTQTSIVLNPAVTISFQPDINNELKFLILKFKMKLKN
ncbi:family A G protein-coupled receptor-like protein [Conidiobolus coronatus NRRL 28638]|uniref:Family A G protein-coupled receptor-like protein n=1 Tax=Conidiobolus coronatus (strain ATCC 28846 / CBS 209.66 / NRRL 28638) TaxID=796925 RepID=A0A137P3K2_CONC2|nr:family A G protein-coupled receptor-like protein [Conidiobolus coronatus NRRL 28638]|eukprot:KXN69607.1 family A G protein-coupled receptor-like protein [Conidiobolus coronatus NRRL 28638]